MSIQSNILLGTVLSHEDPEALGRIQVTLHGFPEAITSPWLQVIQPFTGVSFGAYVLPEVDTTVVILRGFGNAHAGLIVLGALYDATNKPFVTAPAENHIKELRTRSGHALTIDDTEDAGLITVVTGDEKLKIELDVAKGAVTITGDAEVNLVATTAMTLTADTITVTGTTSVTVKDSEAVSIDGAKTVTVTASDAVTIDGGKKVSITAKAIEMK